MNTDSAVLTGPVRAARIGRILFRREPSSEEVAAWVSQLVADASGAALIKTLVDTDQFRALASSDAQQIGRAYDAVMDRYDASLPRDVDHFVQLKRLESSVSIGSLIDMFCKMRDSNYRYDPCASPVDPARPMRLAADAGGNPLIFTVGTNGHLYLFSKQATPDGTYCQIDLSDLLPTPAHGKVLSFDVRQGVQGVIALVIALGPRAGHSASVLYAGLNLSNALDPSGWRDAVRGLRTVPGAADKTVISNVTLSATDGSAVPLLLIGAEVEGVMDDFVINFDDGPGTWERIRLPEDANKVRQLTLGQYQQPGFWVFYDVGADTALTFTTFKDAWGKTINLSYTGLPAHAGVLAIRPGSVPSKPDVFVGGDGLVVYRSAVENPQMIVPATASRGISYINVLRVGGVEHLWFIDDSQTLQYMKMEGGAWLGPVALSTGIAGMEFIGGAGGETPAMVVVTASRTLEIRRRGAGDGTWSATEIPSAAVWQEVPLSSAELASALEGVAPILYADEQEIYSMSTVDYFLAKVGLWTEQKQAWQFQPGELWDPATRDLRPECIAAVLPRSRQDDRKHDSDYALKIPDTEYTTSKEGHPYGDLIAGKPDNALVYVHAKFNPAANATDLVLWTFYPYNGAGTLKLKIMGNDSRSDCYPIGIHEGDWEHVTLRVDNDSKQLVSVYMAQHDGGTFVAPAELERDGVTGRVVLYMSRHGHAIYQHAGDNLSKTIKAGLYEIGLVNHCSKGARVNCWEAGRYSIVSAGFLGAAAPVEPQWLQLPWRWGRYHDFSGAEVAPVISSVMGGPMGALIEQTGIATLVSDIVVASGAMGGEGNTAGPGAPKFKGNWFCSESD